MEIVLPSKPNAHVAYNFFPGDQSSTLLVVCLNGLGLPQQSWEATIKHLQESGLSPKPWVLTYDRYGQGASGKDPRGNLPGKEPGYVHTLDDVTDDLEELIKLVSPDRCSRLVLVNNSIGAHIARRYANRYPTIVEGILFLDSNPATFDHAEVWPNPEDPSFELAKIPDGTLLDEYKAAYTTMTTIFAPTAKNGEGFDRRNIKNLLPESSSPKLKGSKNSDKGPWITVVGHELKTFSEQEWATFKVPIGIAAMYTQPLWHEYNEGLCLLTDPDRAKGPLIAPGCGHFIQKDNPEFVAKQLEELINNVESTK